ncbi:uroporphyrinogen-III C-methyltransferase [Psychrobium sp. MM17-31]|uniref:uroporphyrinogen-III C-methyltransferase n=1 Tax=Psychrobium sp. MM17-31 TaxID=2917758 RepID=UPI001EF63253|nr:uroporphyrinogen-III C-methyltransferase [Psychrobium sp. MM17-31]MCG7532288.1 uroporphyrinogen-III C-methyltransferase [Psychrobium sp. MM17-31]
MTKTNDDASNNKADEKAIEEQQTVDNTEQPNTSEPLAEKEPSADKKSSANEKSSVDEKPVNEEELLVSQKSSSDNESSAQEPSLDESKSLANETTELDNVASSAVGKNEAATSAGTAQKMESTVVTQKTPISKLAVLCLILILALAGAAGYGVDQYQKLQLAQQDTIDSLVAKQNSVLENVNQQLQQQQALNQSLTSELNDKVAAQLAGQEQTQALINQKIAELSGRRPSDWLLAEANYLVTMAGRKLWQEKDQKTAAALLVTADKRIAEMHDESLIELRRALAKDIATLSALPQDRSQDIALAIDGLITQIDNLKLNTVTLPDAVQEEAPAAAEDSWQENLKQTWYGFVDGLITIRKRESNVVPLMSAKQQWYLEENLKNKLVQAQLAVYRKQQQAFISAIEVSRTWVLQFFDREDSATTFMLEELEKLEKVSIEVNYPRDLLSRNLIADEVTRRNISSAQGLER